MQGLVTATAAAFLAERAIPAAIDNRALYLTITFMIALVLVTLNAYRNINKKTFVGHTLYVTAGLILLTLAAACLLFTQALLILVRDGIYTVTGEQVGLLFFAAGSIWIARRLTRSTQDSPIKVVEDANHA